MTQRTEWHIAYRRETPAPVHYITAYMGGTCDLCGHRLSGNDDWTIFRTLATC